MNDHAYFETLYSKLNTGRRVISASCREYLASIAQPEVWHKNERLQLKGHAVTHVWFVTEGCLRTRYFSQKKMDLVTFWLWFPGHWAAAFNHLYSASKSDRIIDAIEDSHVLSFAFADLVAMQQKFPDDWQVINASITEVYIREFDERYSDIVTLSARERYLKLIQARPELFQTLPLKEIASYLKISREELSRLRAEKNIL